MGKNKGKLQKKQKQKDMGAKTRKKYQQKIIDDKTFGLKNKNKSKKVQKFMKQVENKIKGWGQKGKSEQQLIQEKYEAKKRREQEKRDQALLSQMFNGSAKVQKKVKKKNDPKNTICPYFKVGLCKKGKKCKYSHDLKLEQKTAKINIYHDPRKQEEAKQSKEPITKEDDVMDLWDSEKLHQVIAQNQKAYKSRNETKNVCKNFLKAVEGNKYGWFWNCPNGDDCQYRHALPPGYILKRDRQKMRKYDEADQIALEEQLEIERTKIFMKGNGTKVCKESLIKLWQILEKKKEQLEKERLKQMSAKEKKKKSQQVTKLTGKQLFMSDPNLVKVDFDEENGEQFKLDLNDIGKKVKQKEKEKELEIPDTNDQAQQQQEDIQINEALFLEEGDDIDLPDDLPDDI